MSPEHFPWSIFFRTDVSTKCLQHHVAQCYLTLNFSDWKRNVFFNIIKLYTKQYCFLLSLAEGDNLDCWAGGSQDTWISCLKRPSLDCLTTFYKKCLSKPCLVQAVFFQDQNEFTTLNGNTTIHLTRITFLCLSRDPWSNSMLPEPDTDQTLSPTAKGWSF